CLGEGPHHDQVGKLFEHVDDMRTSKISIGLIDHDNTLRTFQKRPQVRTGMQHTCRGIGIDDDYDLGPMRVEILRERIAWPHGELLKVASWRALSGLYSE